jgi:pyridoxamine 5'-phosphate oxidase
VRDTATRRNICVNTLPDLPTLSEEILPVDPLDLFREWFRTAEEHSVMTHPDAMVLGTIGPEGHPSGRVVLLKGVDARGFSFYTNYRSAKAEDLDRDPRVSLTFYWDALGRQVRVRGTAERVSPAESDAYFASRPRGSRLGAWASDQSRELTERGSLEERFRELERRYEGHPVPRPPHWGGFIVVPAEIEFWQAGEYRLHDRFLYRKGPDGWSWRRLYP